MKKCFTKPSKVMKICAAQAMIAMIVCGVSAAHDNYAQLLDKKLTLSLKEVPLEVALKKIESATRVRIFYSIDQLDINEPISIEAKDETLRVVLDDLLSPHNIKYKVNERKRIVILKRQTDLEASSKISLNELSFISATQFQPSIITGIVLDAITQQPMAGVNIILKGTTIGTTTDSEGKYSIEADDDDIIVFSFIGYASFETSVSGLSIIDVSLQEDVTSLGEVVVNAGYWQTTKQEQTGNIARVTAKDIDKQPVPNALMAIQGRMPGVVITQTSGVPGSGMNIQIRGQNSLRTGLNNGNLPLYIVDGVPIASNPIYAVGDMLSASAGGIDPLNLLNPANIESIEILKDADATAIYGSRGANGVVLITTKKGTSGATRFDFQGYTGVGRVSKMMDVMNTQQYLGMRQEALANDGRTPGVSDYDLNGSWSQTADTDWQKELIGGTANLSDIQGSVSGGGDNTSFRFAGGYHRETTVFPGSFGYSKTTGSFNLNHTTTDKKFRISLSINYGRDNNNLFNRNIATYARLLPPNAPSYKDDGSLDWTGYNTDRPNPFSHLKTSDVSKTSNLISNTVLSYEVIKGLKLIANLGYSDNNLDETVKIPLSSQVPSATASTTRLLNYSGQNWIVEPQLSYSTNLVSGRLDFLIGSTWQAFDSKNLSIYGQGYTSDALLGSIAAASTIGISNDAEKKYRYSAIFGRLGYTWKEKYIVNLTARRDGSSRFGADNQFGNFGAVGLAWIFGSEEFISNALPFISFGKLRASYGTSGSDQIGDYGYISTYSPTSTTYLGTGILNPTALANPDFGWEVNRKLEAAIDLSFLQNKIQFSTSWYLNKSSNQLVGFPLPAITGFTSVQYNLDATVQNTGWEFDITSTNIETSDIRWTTALNFTLPKNKLVSYPNLTGSSYANTYVVGQPLSISKHYLYAGVDPETGLYQITDLDDNGSFNDADKQIVIDRSRKFYGGLGNTITFKSFSLNFLLEFVKQNATGYMSNFAAQPGAAMYNQLSLVGSQTRWQGAGDATDLQKFTQSSSLSYLRATVSSENVTNSSYIRMKTIALYYRLPVELGSGLKSADAYIQAQNLFTITTYYGFNPESPYLELPPLRVYSLGLKFGF